jgi:sugar lactone lactonase YvrE
VPATQARLNNPFAIDADRAGNLFLAELTGQRVLKVDPKGVLTVLAGTGKKGHAGDGGPARQAQFNGMHSLAVAPSGDVYLADTWNNRVRKIDAKTGIIRTVAGTGEKGHDGDGGPAIKAKFGGIYCVTFDPKGERLYLADLDNRRIRAVDLATGIVDTVAGNGKKGVPEGGADALSAPLVDPRAVATPCAWWTARGRSAPSSARASRERPATAATAARPPSTGPSTCAWTGTVPSSSPTAATTLSAATARRTGPSCAWPAPAARAPPA